MTDKATTKTTVTTPVRNPLNPYGCGCLGWFVINALILIGIFSLIHLIDTEPLRIRFAQLITGKTLIAPRDLVPAEMVYDSVQLFDTDMDEEQERVLFYHYDSAPSNSVYGATVLDFDQCLPRQVNSYNIIEIDEAILTSKTQNLEIKDIPDVGGPNDLLLWGLAGKLHTELSIFYWYDNKPDICTPPSPATRGYLNLGSFRGNAGVKIEGQKVFVKEHRFKRSLIVRTNVYEPVANMYRESPTGPLLSPIASAIEFTTVPQPDDLDPYFPERSVVWFYMNIGTHTDEAKKVLDPALVDLHIEGQYGKDVAEPGQLTSLAELKEIEYSPDLDQERQCEKLSIDVRVLHSRPDGTVAGPHAYRVWVTGYPNTKALPYGCEWRIVGFDYLE